MTKEPADAAMMRHAKAEDGPIAKSPVAAGRPSRKGLSAASGLGWLAGLGVVGWLIARSDTHSLWAAVLQVKTWLIVIAAWHALPLLFDSIGWKVLLTPPARLGRLMLARWVGEGANALLPIPHLGELLRAHLARTPHHGGAVTGASVLADITLGVTSQVLFTVVGLILIGHLRDGELALNPVALLAPLGGFVIAFFVVQRTGALSAMAERIGRSIGGTGGLFQGATLQRLDEALAAIYRRRLAVAGSVVWHFAAWAISAGEIWILLRVLGHPIPVTAAVSIESLSQAARVAAFFIPAGLGAQEGALLALAVHSGVPAETALAVALIKRARELSLGLPALAIGYLWERRLRGQRNRIEDGVGGVKSEPLVWRTTGG